MGLESNGDPDAAPEGRDPESVTADVADFVADYLEDEAEGSIRPLSAYLRRYPSAEAEVAVEFLRLGGVVDVEVSRGARGGAGRAVTRSGARRDPGPNSVSDSGPDSAAGHPVEGEEPADDAIRVAHYRLVRLLGTGGQGEVWLAVDENLQRKVALKLMTAAFVTEERRGRFRREAESIAKLEHPGLAQVHDADIDSDPPFIAMRYVEGVDLGSSLGHARTRDETTPSRDVGPPVPWIPRDRRELHTVLRFFERAARALHAAHDAGVLHRDVKPGNIMVTGEGEPVLLDFGLAGGDEQAEDALLTREGDVFGTLAYMAPEQLRGETQNVDVRADVWSLGVTLYEALVGDRPFQGGGPGELAVAIDTSSVPDPSARNSAITGDTRVVIETALDRSRERRYASALEFAEDLRRIAEYEPIRARPAGPVLRLRRWCRREPAWASALAVTLVALVAGLIVTRANLNKTRRALDSKTAQQFVAEVPALAEVAPAGALALGLATVELEDTWRTRSALYPPLLDATLHAQFAIPEARVWDVVFTSPTDVVFGGKAGAVTRGELNGGRTLARADVGADVRALAYDAAAKQVFVGTSNGRVIQLRRDSLKETAAATVGASPVIDLAVVGDLVVALCVPSTLVLLSRDGCVEQQRIELGEGAFAKLAAPDAAGTLLVSPRAFHGMRRVTNAACLVSLTTGSVEARFEHPVALRDFAVARRAAKLATVDRDGCVRLFDLATGQAVVGADGRPFALEHELPGASIEITPDGNRIVVGLDSRGIEDPARFGTVFCYDVGSPSGAEREIQGEIQSGAPVEAATLRWSLRGTGRVVDLAFAPGLSCIATASWDNLVRVLDASTGRTISMHREHERPNDLFWSTDSELLASIGSDNTMNAWRRRRSALGFRFDAVVDSESEGRSAVEWGSFTSDGQRVCLLDADGHAAIFDAPRPGADRRNAPRGRSPGVRLARIDTSIASAAGARACVARSAPVAAWVGPAGAMRSVDTVTLLTRATAIADGFTEGELGDLSISDDGKVLAAIDSSGVAWLWRAGDPPKPLLKPEFQRAHEWLGATRLSIAGDGQSVVLGDAAGRVVQLALGGASTGEPLWFPPPVTVEGAPVPLEPLADLELSPDGQTLVAAAGRDHLVFWESAGRTLLDIEAPRLRRESVQWLDNERLVTIGTGSGSVQVVTRGKPVLPAHRHSRSVASASVSAEGRLAATGSIDGEVLVWDAGTGETMSRASVHDAAVTSLSFDGLGAAARVLSCSSDGAAIWPVEILDAARELRARALTPLERRILTDLQGTDL